MIYFIIFSCLFHFIVGVVIMTKATNRESFDDGLIVFLLGFFAGGNMLTSILLIFGGLIWMLITLIENLSDKLYKLKQ